MTKSLQEALEGHMLTILNEKMVELEPISSEYSECVSLLLRLSLLLDKHKVEEKKSGDPKTNIFTTSPDDMMSFVQSTRDSQ